MKKSEFDSIVREEMSRLRTIVKEEVSAHKQADDIAAGIDKAL